MRQGTKQAGFTLLELLVVIAIIAILMSLSVAAVMRMRLIIPKVQTADEISRLHQGVSSFMADYQLNSPPPSHLYLHEDGNYDIRNNSFDKQTVDFLQKWQGKKFDWTKPRDWNGNGKIDPAYML
jgi:prepilin-type N-terminal cleavage/methylation domain-containing protein